MTSKPLVGKGKVVKRRNSTAIEEELQDKKSPRLLKLQEIKENYSVKEKDKKNNNQKNKDKPDSSTP